jgi:hypothetical protein
MCPFWLSYLVISANLEKDDITGDASMSSGRATVK